MPTTDVKKPIRRTKELEPDDERVEQLSDINFGLGNTPFTHPGPAVVEIEKPLLKDYMELLKFNEEPVEIEGIASADPHAPMFLEAWVQGKGIEQWVDKIGWVEVKFIPVNTRVTIKRKYLEVLIRSKVMGVHTVEDKADGSEPRNILRRTSAHTMNIRIIKDTDPPGQQGYREEWARRIMRQSI